MTLFDIIASSLVPSANTAKGSIVSIATDATKVYDQIGSPSKVLATYNVGKILGTVQQIGKGQVIKNGVLTNDFFVIVRVKLSEPLTTTGFAAKTYTDVWVLAENLSVFAAAAIPTATATEVPIYSIGTGVRVRTTASVIGTLGDVGNNIITSYDKGDLIGLSDKNATNGFYKVKFLTSQTKKSDGKKYEVGYVSTAYSSSVEPVKTPVKTTTPTKASPVQNGNPKTVKEADVKNIPSTDDTTNSGFYRNRYGVVLIGAAIFGLLGVIAWAVNKLSKQKRNGIIANR